MMWKNHGKVTGYRYLDDFGITFPLGLRVRTKMASCKSSVSAFPPGVRIEIIDNCQRSAFGSMQEQTGRGSSMAGFHDLGRAHLMGLVAFAV